MTTMLRDLMLGCAIAAATCMLSIVWHDYRKTVQRVEYLESSAAHQQRVIMVVVPEDKPMPFFYPLPGPDSVGVRL